MGGAVAVVVIRIVEAVARPKVERRKGKRNGEQEQDELEVHRERRSQLDTPQLAVGLSAWRAYCRLS